MSLHGEQELTYRINIVTCQSRLASSPFSLLRGARALIPVMLLQLKELIGLKRNSN